LLLIFGYQQWKARVAQTRAEAAMQYAAFAEAVDAKRSEDATRIAEALRKDFPNSPYAAFATLSQAESEAVKGDLKAAAGSLESAAKLASDPSMKSLIALRQARVSLALGDPDVALGHLDRIAKSDFPDLAGELRGDALGRLGRPDDARAAYTEALAHMDLQSPSRSFVEMKLGDLKSSTTPEKQKS
jgi:predicted negative regulator of RcsB-dependent stress response